MALLLPLLGSIVNKTIPKKIQSIPLWSIHLFSFYRLLETRRKMRGFRLGRKLVTMFKRAPVRKRKQACHLEAAPSPISKTKTMSKIYDWSRSLKRRAKGLWCGKPASGYARLRQETFDAKPAVAVPKGHLAVYVGEDGYSHRFLVPIIYFNHPLFSELLREAEKEYGFEHPGGITIPCRVSDFESLQSRIAAGENFRKQALKHRI